MLPAVTPHVAQRQAINEAVRAEINLCYTCGSCVAECPVNRATNRLQPRTLVWMANLGLLDELVRLPDIWFCILCNRCSHVCPMTVKPSRLIRYLRWEAVHGGSVAPAFPAQWKALYRNFQDARYAAAALCGEGKGLPADSGELFETRGPAGNTAPLEVPRSGGGAARRSLARAVSEYRGYPTHVSSCFACGECSNACPVALNRAAFDPLAIIRSTLVGAEDELLRSPSIWLCIACESCSRTCGMGVKGHFVMRRLQELSVSEGAVDEGFPLRWQACQSALYETFVERVVSLLAGL